MRSGIVALLWLLLWVSMPAVAAAPEASEVPRLRVLGVAAGLPASDVTGLARDREGFVWVATNDGLARYDGVEFTVWQHDPQDPRSLPGNGLQALHIDHENRIWVGAQDGGVGVMGADRAGFQRYSPPLPYDTNLNQIWHFASRPGEIWMGSGSDGVIGVLGDGRVVHLRHDPEDSTTLPSNTITYLSFDAEGVLWIATTRGVASYDGQRIRREALPGAAATMVTNSVSAMDGEIWAGGAAGVFVRTREGVWEARPWTSMFERPNTVLSIQADARGGYWLASRRGLWRLASADGIPVPVPVGIDGGGRAYTARAVLAQPDGSVWSSAGEGVGYLRSDWRQVRELLRGENGPSGQSYLALARANDGGLWIGAESGVIEHLDAALQLSPVDEALAARVQRVRVLALAETTGGTLWISHANGLLRRRPDGRVEEFEGEPDSVMAAGLGYSWLRAAPDGGLWASRADGRGLEYREGDSGRLRWTSAAEPQLAQGSLMFASTPAGTLWLTGSHSGFGWWSHDERRFHALDTTATYFALAAPDEDTVWASRTGALERWRRVGGEWIRDQVVTRQDGLPVVMAMAMAVDARGRPWVSTRRGLYRWDPDARQLRHFGTQHGLTSQEMLHRALMIGASGQLVAPTAGDSLVLIDTLREDEHVSAASPALHLLGLDVRRGGVWQRLDSHRTIELSPTDREFRVSARLLAYDDPASNRYWSKLEGHDSDWIEQGASGDRVFAGLRPGRHTLELRAGDAYGRMTDVLSFSIHVLPPWWRTWWAIALYALAGLTLLASAALIYRGRVRRRSAWQIAERERALVEQASLAKSRFLATLGHEVRTPMTGVLGMSELLLDTPLDARQREYTLSIRRAGDHLMRLVNDALDLARIEAGKLQLDLQPLDLHALVQDIVAFCAPMARRKSLGLDVALAPDLPAWVVGDATRVRQVLLNLLGNALKFTERGHVALAVGSSDGQVEFTVSDSGPGVSAEQIERLFRRFEQAEGARTAARYGGSGLGLAISQELAAAMGGRIQVDSTPGLGSRFTVTLPLQRIETPADRGPQASHERITAAVGLEVLLVEDDETVAQVITGLLQGQGHQVVHVVHGLAALTEVGTRGFDLALLDLDLPGVDGITLAGLLRGQGFRSPLVAVTARADADAEPAARAAGFNGFLRKPLTGEMLADAVAQGWRPQRSDAGPGSGSGR